MQKHAFLPLLIVMIATGCTVMPSQQEQNIQATPHAVHATQDAPHAGMPVAPHPITAPLEASQDSKTPNPVVSEPPTPLPDFPEIRPGECWVQAVIHARPIKEPVEIVVRDAVNDIDVTPPELRPTWKEVIFRDGGITYRIESPVYKRVTEKVLVRPEIRRTIVVPAVFEEREEKIVIEAEHTILERCKISTSRLSPDIPVQPLCARRVPAKTKTIKRKVLVQPETTREIVEPLVFKDVSRWVIEKPSRVIPVEIPPKTGKLRATVVASPEHVEERQLPPKILKLITTRFTGSPKIVFRRAVCDQDITPALIEAPQRALLNAGFHPGPIDGKFGKRTHLALLNYQRQNGLAFGALTYESLEHLGVPVNR